MSLDAALADWRCTLGAANVIEDTASLLATEKATFATSFRIPALIRPGSREEVQESVRIARQYGIAVYPVSRGCNWGFGSRVPPANGCVVMELARLDRIRAFDEALAYVTVEPGVTQGMLHKFLQERKSRLVFPIIGSSPRASLIGNALERGAGAGPGGYRADNVCNLEVVLPDGSLFSNAAEFGSATPLTRDMCGPGLDQLFFQSNLGVVTAMTFWLTSLGSHPQICYFAAQSEASLAALVDGLRGLLLHGIIRPSFSIRNDYRTMAARQQYPWDAMEGRVPLPRTLIQRINSIFGSRAWWGAQWKGFVWLQGGSAAHAAALREVIADRLSNASDRLVFIDDNEIHISCWDMPATVEQIRASFKGSQPTHDFRSLPRTWAAQDAYWRKRTPPPNDPDPSRDGCGEVYCAPQVPITGEHITRVCGILESVILGHGFEPCLNVIVMNERCTYVAAQVFFDRETPGEDERALKCRQDAHEMVRAAGYPVHRTDILDMSRIASANPARSHFAATLKLALDPDNLVSPGRYEAISNPRAL